MVDVPQHVAHWRKTAEEDWQVAQELLDRGRPRHGLFFVHLAVEKLLKAHVSKKTRDVAPRMHNLLRLAERADLELPEEQVKTLGRLNQFNIEGRYPEDQVPPPSRQEAERYFQQAAEIRQWLLRLF